MLAFSTLLSPAYLLYKLYAKCFYLARIMDVIKEKKCRQFWKVKWGLADFIPNSCLTVDLKISLLVLAKI